MIRNTKLRTNSIVAQFCNKYYFWAFNGTVCDERVSELTRQAPKVKTAKGTGSSESGSMSFRDGLDDCCRTVGLLGGMSDKLVFVDEVIRKLESSPGTCSSTAKNNNLQYVLISYLTNAWMQMVETTL